MKCMISDTDGFRFFAEVARTGGKPGCSLSIASLWAGARRPDDPHRICRLNLDEAGLLALRELLDAAIGQQA